jgi:hypothetical protein
MSKREEELLLFSLLSLVQHANMPKPGPLAIFLVSYILRRIVFYPIKIIRVQQEDYVNSNFELT